MKSFRHLYRATSIGVAGIAGLALAGGCCTKSYKSASYQTSQPSYAETTTAEPAPAPTGRTEAIAASGSTNMVVPLYQESLNVGKREVETGTVRLRKVVKTETVSQPIELRHEELVIDRDSSTAASGNQVLSQPFQEGETVINLKSELPVVEKQTSQSGAIVVQTRSSSFQTNIQAQVRREDIDIDKGNAQNVIIGQNVQSSASASGASESAGGQSKGAAASGTVTDAITLSASSDPSQWVGRQVQLSGVKVRQVTGNVVVLDAGNQKPISVMCSEQPNCKAGDMVNISGQIKASSDASGLSGAAAQEISSRPCYIQAEKVEISNQ